jgi:hypothetical protein
MPSLLILQFDSEKLRRDGLCLQDQAELTAQFGQLTSNADVALRATKDEADLLAQLAELAEQKRSFDVVVCIGHSNENGIKLASNRFADWEVFAGYLKPFKPRRLMLIACSAGRWPAANVLFRKLSTLRRIYASPVNASKHLASLMLWCVPYLLKVKAPPKSSVTYAQLTAMLLAGGQIREWHRTRDKDNPEGILLDLMAQLADPLLRKLRAASRLPGE